MTFHPIDLTWVEAAPLARHLAALTEGRCPRCAVRLSPTPPAAVAEALGPLPDLTPDDHPAYASGGCSPCGYWLLAGAHGSDGHDWFAVTLIGAAGSVMTLTMNPPDSDDDLAVISALPDDW